MDNSSGLWSDMPVLEAMNTGEVEQVAFPFIEQSEEMPNQTGTGVPVDDDSQESMRKEEALKKRSETNKELQAEDFAGDGFRCLSAAQAISKRFHGYRFMAEFLIKNVEYPEGMYPDDILRNIFATTIKQMIKGTKEMGIKANHYIVQFNSSLMDHSVPLHLHKLNQDSVEVVLHKFRTVDQSGEQRGKDSLTTQAFLIDATAYELPEKSLAPKRPLKRRYPGRGRGGKIRIRDYIFKHNINEKALIELDNDDNWCLFRAFELLRQKHQLSYQNYYAYERKDEQQLADVQKLLEWTGIPDDLDNYDVTCYGQRIQDYYDALFPGQFRLMAFAYYGSFEPFWKSEPAGKFQKVLSVFYREDTEHYVPINKVGKLFEKSGIYCFACERPYTHPASHRTNCANRCMGCRRIGVDKPCEEDGGEHFCADCNKSFNSKSCFDYHKKPTKQKNSICSKYKCCSTCKIHYKVKWTKGTGEREQRKVLPHVCNERFCRRCLGTHGPRNCFIRPVEIKEDRPVRIVTFDFECQTALQPDPNLMRFKHEVNFAYCHVFCTQCLKEGTWDEKLAKACSICGPNRLHSWSPFPYEKTPVDVMNVTDDPLGDFVHWLLTYFLVDKKKKRKKDEGHQAQEQEEKMKSVETLVFSHFGGRYDNILIMGELVRKAGLLPNLTRQGNKLYQMQIKKNGVINPTIFHDSYNLIPIKLANFVETFDLKIDGLDGKLWFPYEYNKECNYGKVLSHLPDKADYNADGLLRKARVAFDDWYEQNYETEFNLNEMLASYCSSDVKILTHGLVKMVDLFREATGMNILESVTISGACMKYFRTQLEPNYLALVPHLGYEEAGQQSSKARRFLKWLTHTEKLDIQYVDNGGEKRYKQYLLDGYVKNAGQGRDLAIEIFGCYWHACPFCFPKLGDDDVLGQGKRVGDIRQANIDKCESIMEEMDLRIYWEHEIDELYEKDLEYRAFAQNCIDSGPIQIRDAFFGGRTGPEWLFASAEMEEIPRLNGKEADLSVNIGNVSAEEWLRDLGKRRIKMYDFVSLYPNENFKQLYPVKHPKCTIINKKVDYRRSEDLALSIDEHANNLVHSVAKVFIVPPRHIDIPVLPQRFGDERLLFSLCSKCPVKYKKGGMVADYFCPHFEDEQRGWVATMDSLELAEALDAGYRITKIFRAYHWDTKDMDDGLFKDYVRKFLRLKYMSSGWPAAIKAMEGAEQVRAMREYCEKANKEYGLDIRPRDIQWNPGLKFISKLMLNCLWGRFALRNRLSQTAIVTQDVALADYLNDERIEFSMIEQISEFAMMIVYKTKDDYVIENPSSNLLLALWTTASGRVRLLNTLQMLMKRKDVRILYMDTDSVAFDYSETLGDPITPGMHLGELSDVYPGEEILEFVNGGAKVYTVKLRSKSNGDIRYDQKLKGVTLDMRNSQIFNHVELKRRALRKMNGEDDAPLEMDYRNFKLSRDGQIHTLHSKKKFQINLNKGVLMSHGQIVPFGFSGNILDPRNDEYYLQSTYHEKRRDKLAEILSNRYHPSDPLNHFLHNNNYFLYPTFLQQIYNL